MTQQFHSRAQTQEKQQWPPHGATFYVKFYTMILHWMGGHYCLWNQNVRVQTLALPLNSCVTLDKSLNLSVPRFPRLYTGLVISDLADRTREGWMNNPREVPSTPRLDLRHPQKWSPGVRHAQGQSPASRDGSRRTALTERHPDPLDTQDPFPASSPVLGRGHRAEVLWPRGPGPHLCPRGGPATERGERVLEVPLPGLGSGHVASPALSFWAPTPRGVGRTD